MTTFLRLHSFLSLSRANGPGRRAVLWLQGCTLGCPGCFNPNTHSPEQGEWRSTDDLLENILGQAGQIEGLTVSGGEPMQQAEALFSLLDALRCSSSLSVLVFSGYTWREITRSAPRARLLPLIDVLIAGRYLAQQRTATGLLGSSNQTIHLLTGRYTLADLQAAPSAEAIIGPRGEVILSGIDPL